MNGRLCTPKWGATADNGQWLPIFPALQEFDHHVDGGRNCPDGRDDLEDEIERQFRSGVGTGGLLSACGQSWSFRVCLACGGSPWPKLSERPEDRQASSQRGLACTSVATGRAIRVVEMALAVSLDEAAGRARSPEGRARAKLGRHVSVWCIRFFSGTFDLFLRSGRVWGFGNVARPPEDIKNQSEAPEVDAASARAASSETPMRRPAASLTTLFQLGLRAPRSWFSLPFARRAGDLDHGFQRPPPGSRSGSDTPHASARMTTGPVASRRK
jgi:hypothetical protein